MSKDTDLKALPLFPQGTGAWGLQDGSKPNASSPIPPADHEPTHSWLPHLPVLSHACRKTVRLEPIYPKNLECLGGSSTSTPPLSPKTLPSESPKAASYPTEMLAWDNAYMVFKTWSLDPPGDFMSTLFPWESPGSCFAQIKPCFINSAGFSLLHRWWNPRPRSSQILIS